METPLLTELEEPLDLNTASAEDLRRLRGIGQKLAARIVAARQAQGRFEDVGELLLVPGLNARVLERILPRLVIAGERARPSAVPTPSPVEPRESASPVADEDVVLLSESMLPPSARAALQPPPPAPIDAGPQPTASLGPPALPVAAPPALSAAPPALSAAPPALVEREPREKPAVAPRSSEPPANAQAAPPSEPMVAEARPPEPSPARAEQRPRRWGRAAIAATMGLALITLGLAGTTGAIYGGRLGGYATQSDVKAQADQLWTELDTVKNDQRKVSATVDLMAEVAAQFPRTALRVDSLRSGAEAQQKEAAEALATNQRLSRELAILHATVRKGQKDTDRRMFEMRLDLESGPRDRALRPSKEARPADPTARKHP